MYPALIVGVLGLGVRHSRGNMYAGDSGWRTCERLRVWGREVLRGLGGIHAERAQLDGCLEEVVVAFRLRLGLYPGFAPDINAVPPHKHS